MAKPNKTPDIPSLATMVQESLRVAEATQTVEDLLRLEDTGWTNFSQQHVVISDTDRINNLKLSRLYALKDPLGKQSIRLWTDYSFGRGIAWSVPEEEKATREVLEAFWGAAANRSVLAPTGQRMGSNKLLIDGEVFFAIFLGQDTTIRYVEPLEITEIIADPDDAQDVRYYKREWTTPQNESKTAYYRSVTNIKDEGCLDAAGANIQMTEKALIYQLPYNTISRRGNPLLLPALDWITQYRRFLASRIAIMLALARFAWHTKAKGGQAAVDGIKAKTHEKEIPAGSHLIENLGVDTQPIKTDTGASNAWQDGRMIRLQLCAAVGIPEQYFGDISTGSLATAQTVELPMLKMFGSYQQVWAETYKAINEVVLDYNKIPKDAQYVDLDFPAIAPQDALAAADALSKIIVAFPQLSESDDVLQQALMALGVNDPAKVIEELNKATEGNREAQAIRSLRRIAEAVDKGRKA